MRIPDGLKEIFRMYPVLKYTTYLTPLYTSEEDAETEKERQRRNARARKGKFPGKELARRLVRAAIQRGDLVRPTECEVCCRPPGVSSIGTPLVQAHHDDYAKPLDVRWVCQLCHAQIHRALLEKE